MSSPETRNQGCDQQLALPAPGPTLIFSSCNSLIPYGTSVGGRQLIFLRGD